jgi:hypothetical protein
MSAGRQLEIRRAGPEDAPSIAAVLHRSFLESKPLYTDGGFAATTPGAEQVLAHARGTGLGGAASGRNLGHGG